VAFSVQSRPVTVRREFLPFVSTDPLLDRWLVLHGALVEHAANSYAALA